MLLLCRLIGRTCDQDLALNAKVLSDGELSVRVLRSSHVLARSRCVLAVVGVHKAQLSVLWAARS